MIKHGIITGSSRGIGLATAQLLLQDDNTAVIGTSTSGQSGIKAQHFKCLPLDLAEGNSIHNFVKHIGDRKIDFLINNAAILVEDGHRSEINMQQLRKTFEVNLFGTIALTEALLPKFNTNAHIINITSNWGAFSDPHFDEYQPHYKLSKAALNMYTRLLAKRLEEKNITVSSLDPGWVQSDMGGDNAHRQPKTAATEILQLLGAKVETGQFWHKGNKRKW